MLNLIKRSVDLFSYMNPNKQKKRILVVDDEAPLREVLVEILQDQGFECIPASNGVEAYDLLIKSNSDNPIDAIISDINMPKMDGLIFLEKIREKGFDTPFVILTGYGDKERVKRALVLGAFNFLEKPFNEEEFMATMTSAAELGFISRTNKEKIQSMVSSKKMTSEDRTQFEKISRELMAMKNLNQLMKKKAG